MREPQKSRHERINMKWIRFTIHTKVDAVDVLSYELDAIGVEGIEIEDSLPLSAEDKEKMFVDILPDPVETDDLARVSFYKDAADCDPESMIAKVQEILSEVGSYMDIGEGRVEISETEDKDWINNWKEFFKPFQASEHIYVCPTWIEDRERQPEGVETLLIDPGIAFGTGSHETTKLCIQAIDGLLCKGDRVLDVGCGSGILSIVSLLLGAGFATAIDIDRVAVEVAKENFDVNGIEPSAYELIAGNILSDDGFADEIRKKASLLPAGGYDVVVANILPDVIVPLTPMVPEFLKDGGYYITSGILATRAPEVENALKNSDFEEIKCIPMGEWVAFTSKKTCK